MYVCIYIYIYTLVDAASIHEQLYMNIPCIYDCGLRLGSQGCTQRSLTPAGVHHHQDLCVYMYVCVCVCMYVYMYMYRGS